jgi:hypothetical protein
MADQPRYAQRYPSQQALLSRTGYQDPRLVLMQQSGGHVQHLPDDFSLAQRGMVGVVATLPRGGIRPEPLMPQTIGQRPPLWQLPPQQQQQTSGRQRKRGDDDDDEERNSDSEDEDWC